MLGYGGILRGRATAAVGAVALVLASGCGGGGERQDAADEPATYQAEIVRDSFPARQELAEETELRVTVRNDSDRTIPNLAVTIEMDRDGTRTAAFGLRSREPGLSTRSRPVWVLDEGPLSGETAYANTWALGPLPAGEETTFAWRVTAVEPGRYVLRYRLAGGLTGAARLENAGGRVPQGRFVVDVDRRPGGIRITDDGRIVRVPAREADRAAPARH